MMAVLGEPQADAEFDRLEAMLAHSSCEMTIASRMASSLSSSQSPNVVRPSECLRSFRAESQSGRSQRYAPTFACAAFVAARRVSRPSRILIGGGGQP